MGDRRREGTLPQPEAADEAERDGGPRGVAVHHGDLQEIARRVRHRPSAGNKGAHPRTPGHELAVSGDDDREGARAGGNGEVRGPAGKRAEPVHRRRAQPGKEAAAAGGRQPSADVGPADPEISPVVDDDKVRRVPGLEKPDIEPVVADRVHRRAGEHVEPARARGQPAADVRVDVAEHQQVGMQVVAAKHAAPRIGPQERGQGVEIPGGGALADEDHHSRADLVARLGEGEALVVGRDTRRRVGHRLAAPQAGRMAVHRFARPDGRRDLGHDAGIAAQDAGEIHDLRKIADLPARHQAGNRPHPERRARRLRVGRRDAGGRAEAKLEGRPPRLGQHGVDAAHTQHVGDLMRIGNRRHRAMDNRQPRELRRRQKGALDVDMGVDEAGHDESGGPGAGIPLDPANDALRPGNRAGKNPAVHGIDDRAGDAFHARAAWAAADMLQSLVVDRENGRLFEQEVREDRKALNGRAQCQAAEPTRGWVSGWDSGGSWIWSDRSSRPSRPSCSKGIPPRLYGHRVNRPLAKRPILAQGGSP